MEVDEFLPLSGLQHLVFCERQAALIHIDRLWRDDVATVQGNIVHQRVHEPGVSGVGEIRVVRALPITSVRLGVSGVADMVELHPSTAPRGVTPIPIEVKKGSARMMLANEVQLCAQAICLEEMFEVEVSQGFLFYAESHRRRAIPLGASLRDRTIKAAARFHELVRRSEVPSPQVDDRVCATCSIEPLCLPKAVRNPSRASAYLRALGTSDD